MSFKKNAIKRASVYTLTVCFILALSSPFLIKLLINSQPVKNRLTLEIEKYSGIEIRPDTIEFILSPFPGIRFLDMDLRFNREIALTIDRTEVAVDLSQLLNRKILIKKIEITGSELMYTPLEPDSDPDHAPSQIISRQIVFDGMVDKLFHLIPDSKEDLDISINGFKAAYFSSMNARLKVPRNKSGLNFTALISQIDINHEQLPIVDTFTARTIKRVKAQALHLDLNLDTSNTLAGDLRIIEPETIINQVTEPSLKAPELALDFSFSDKNISARLVPNAITYPKGNLGIEFNHHIETGKSNITFSGKDIDVGQARDVCLPLLKGINVADIIFDILRGGQAKDIIVGFEADRLENLFDGKNLTLKGVPADVTVKIPGVPLTIEHVSGKVEIKKGVLSVEAHKGSVQSARIQKGVFNIDLMNYPDEPFSGKFHLKADLSHLPETLMGLLPGTRLAQQLSLVSQMDGQADGILELDMPTGAKELGVRVTAKNIRASGRYRPIPLPFTVSQGEFSYNADRIRVKNLNATIGQSPVNGLNGEISLEDIPILSVEQAQATLSTHEFLPWIKEKPSVMAKLSPVQNVSGPINISSAKIQGPMFNPAKWQFEFIGNSDKIHLGFTKNEFSARNLSCSFKIDQDSFEISKLSTRIDDLAWLGSKKPPEDFSSIEFPIHLRDGEGQVNSKKHFFKAGLHTKNGPVITLNLIRGPDSDLRPTRIMIKDGENTDALIVLSQAPDQPKIRFKGHLNTSSLEKLVIKDSSLYKKLFSITQGQPITISTDNESRIHIKANEINLALLLSQFKTDDTAKMQNTAKAPDKVHRPLLAQKDLFLKADTLVFKNQIFTKVDTRVSFEPEKTKIRINQAAFCDLTAKGTINLDFQKKKPMAATEFNFSSTGNQDISNVFDCVFRAKSIIEGQYTFKGKVYGNDEFELIGRRQNGEMFFDAKQGRIYKATILSRLLSVLNILGSTDIRQEGFGYKTLTISADVKDSVIHLKKVYIDADDMAIIASGWVDPLKDELNVTFLVAPFKTIDTIIQHIPLVNTILSGRLVSFPAKATGRISDPTIIPLHPSAVGTGLLTLFGDLLKAPVRLFEGEKANE